MEAIGSDAPGPTRSAESVVGRQVPAYRLRTWLLAKGYAEEKRGYGHVSAEELADALLESWDVRYRSEQNDGRDDGTR